MRNLQKSAEQLSLYSLSEKLLKTNYGKILAYQLN